MRYWVPKGTQHPKPNTAQGDPVWPTGATTRLCRRVAHTWALRLTPTVCPFPNYRGGRWGRAVGRGASGAIPGPSGFPDRPFWFVLAELCNNNYDLGPDGRPAAPPVRAWAKHRPGLGGARRAVHVRRRVSGRTGRLDGLNGHLAKSVTATSGVAPDARSAARCARSGAASPRVWVGGSVGAGSWEGGFRCVSGAFRFSRSPFLVCTGRIMQRQL